MIGTAAAGCRGPSTLHASRPVPLAFRAEARGPSAARGSTEELMPTYEYSCPNGHRFDRFQKMSDPPEAQCPECGEPGERKISAGAGFLFKGDGFYITDYRSPDYKAKDRAESGKDGAVASDGKPPKPKTGGGKADGKAKASEKPGSGTSSTSGSKDA